MIWTTEASSSGLIKYADGRPEQEVGGMSFFFLDCLVESLGSDWAWTMRSYSPPADLPAGNEQLWADQVLSDMRELQVTMAWVNKGTTAVKIFNEKTGQVRDWMDLGEVRTQMVMKIMKRLAAFAWRSYMHAKWTRVLFTTEDKPIPHIPGTVSICFRTSASPLRDGVTIVRPSFIKDLCRNIEDDRLRYKSMKAQSIHFRMAFPAIDATNKYLPKFPNGGLIKGNGVAAVSDDAIPADLYVDLNNARPELGLGLLEEAWCEAFVQGQYKKVFTNRQVFFHAYSWLYQNHVQNSMRAEIERMLEVDVKEFGIAPHRPDPAARQLSNHELIERDSVQDYNWAYETMRLNGIRVDESPYTLQSALSAGALTLHPFDRPDDERKMPVEDGVRMSIYSETTARDAGYDIPKMKKGEALFLPFGFIIADCIFEFVMDLLGGADQDDKGEIFPVIVPENYSECKANQIPTDNNGGYYRLRKGDIALPIFRTPVGGITNGKNEIGSEYYILKLHSYQREEWKKKDLRHLSMAGRPKMGPEVKNIPPAKYTPAPIQLPATYTQMFVANAIPLSVRAMTQYRKHASYVMYATSAGVALDYIAPETVWIDSSAQEFINPANVTFMERGNKTHARTLLRCGATFDVNVAKKLRGLIAMELGMKPSEVKLKSDVGLLSAFIKSHKELMYEYQTRAKVIIREAVAARKGRAMELANGAKLIQVDGYWMPIMHARFRMTTDWLLRQKSATREFGRHDLKHEDWVAIGNMVVSNSMDKHSSSCTVCGGEGETLEQLIDLTLEAYAWSIRNAKFNDSRMLSSFLVISDQALCNGDMVSLLIDALKKFGRATGVEIVPPMAAWYDEELPLPIPPPEWEEYE